MSKIKPGNNLNNKPSVKKTDGLSLDGHIRPQLVHSLQISQKRIAGPIPSSEEMAGYKLVDERFPDRIMTMSEKNQTQRHKRENDELRFPFLLARTGQYSGIGFTFLFYCTGVAGVIFNYPELIWFGFGPAITTTLAGIFFKSNKL
jgi:uncharacterized membrane protein